TEAIHNASNRSARGYNNTSETLSAPSTSTVISAASATGNPSSAFSVPAPSRPALMPPSGHRRQAGVPEAPYGAVVVMSINLRVARNIGNGTGRPFDGGVIPTLERARHTNVGTPFPAYQPAGCRCSQR